MKNITADELNNIGALVSVIVPIYNVEKYLDRCLQSIVGQSYTNLEIILVDDGSPDHCPQMCDEWAQKDARIRVIHKQNAGLGMARNSGMEIASGEYWMFVDSDDYIAEDAVEVLLKRIIEDGSDMAAGRFVNVYDNGKTEDRACSWMKDTVMTSEAVFQRMGEEYDLPPMAWGKLYRSSIFSHLKYTALKYSEDLWMFILLLDKCNNISVVNALVYYYFQRDDSIVHLRTEQSRIDAVYANLFAAKYLYQENYQKSAQRRYYFAICEALWLNDKKVAKRMIKEMFSIGDIKAIMMGAGFETALRSLLLLIEVPISFMVLIKQIKTKK